MSDYTDARLALKRDRQDAKLAKAQANRTASGRNATLNTTKMFRYGAADNDPANYVAASTPLAPGRPWEP